MRYMGGKSKIRKQVSSFLESIRKQNQVYLEPFVGAGWILQEMSGERIASDANIALITMYQSLQDGWVPPDEVSEDTWRHYRKIPKPINDPLMAFCRIGVGFGGDWNGGYARTKKGGEDYCKSAKNSLLKQLPFIKDVSFLAGDYTIHTPNNRLVYCDPPYQGTTSYGACDFFDHDKFWDVMREWSKTNTVVISEYSAPPDFICVRGFFSRMGLKNKNEEQEIRTEKVFMHESQAHLATPKTIDLLIY